MLPVITRCDPPIPMVSPKGKSLAIWRIEHGMELPTHYEVHVTEGKHAGEIWEFRQQELRAEDNITLGRQATQTPPTQRASK